MSNIDKSIYNSSIVIMVVVKYIIIISSPSEIDDRKTPNTYNIYIYI